MIKNISATGRYIQVQGGMPSTVYFNNFSGAMGVGDVRYNTNSQSLEVYDGTTWMQFQGGYPMISLTPEAETLLDWAREQRNKQWELDELAKTKPAVQAAIANLNNAKAQLEATVILSKETL